MLTDRTEMLRWLHKADKEGFAIPHFNYNDIWDMRAIIEAAEALRSPVIIACLTRVVDAHGVERLSALARETAKQASVPVFVHLDHSKDLEHCESCAANGFTAVMYDGSALSLEENISGLKRCTAFAHPKGVLVEGELGRILGNNIEGKFDGGDFLAQTKDVVALSQQTDVDMLAVGIGTAHGFYEGKPEIHFDRLEEINAAVDTFLVLHGGTGIPLEDIRRAIKLGINKVNVGTMLKFTYMSTLQSELNDKGPNVHPMDLMPVAVEKIGEKVRESIDACMADNRA